MQDNPHPQQPDAEDVRLNCLRLQGDPTAVKQLFERNYAKYGQQLRRMAIKRNVPTDEATSLAMIALLKAILNYQPEKGRISNYATFKMRTEIQTYKGYSAHAVRVPELSKKTQKKLAKAWEEISKRENRKPLYTLNQELSEIAGTYRSETEAWLNKYRPDVPIDQTDSLVEPQISKENGPEIGVIDYRILLSIIEAKIQRLTPAQARVIRMNFGLVPSEHPMALTEIAETLGVSHQAIQQLRSEGLKKLQKWLSSLKPEAHLVLAAA